MNTILPTAKPPVNTVADLTRENISTLSAIAGTSKRDGFSQAGREWYAETFHLTETAVSLRFRPLVAAGLIIRQKWGKGFRTLWTPKGLHFLRLLGITVTKKMVDFCTLIARKLNVDCTLITRRCKDTILTDLRDSETIDIKTTNRQRPQEPAVIDQPPVVVREGKPERKAAIIPPITTPEPPTEPDPVVVAQLVVVGVSRPVAVQLAAEPAECVRQLEYLPYRGAKDPAAVLVKSIREEWSPPIRYRLRGLKPDHAKSRTLHPNSNVYKLPVGDSEAAGGVITPKAEVKPFSEARSAVLSIPGWSLHRKKATA